MMRLLFRPALLFIALIFILASGCGRTRIPVMDYEKGVELRSTPFFAQEDYQCGPSSLAMLLSASGIKVVPEDVTSLTYLPERRGSLQLELKASARHFGRIPYQIEPTLDGIVGELKAGRPVLILQKQGFAFWPAYHYAVVIGILPGDRLVLRSGAEKRVEMSADNFLLLWNRADSWGIVTLKPGEIPFSAEAQDFIEAVSAFEDTGRAKDAAASYASALKKWPANSTVLFATATNLLIQGHAEQAGDIYQRLLEQYPDDIAAANNYAEALLMTGDIDSAESIITKAIDRSKKSGSGMTDVLIGTLQNIESIKKQRAIKNRGQPF